MEIKHHISKIFTRMSNMIKKAFVSLPTNDNGDYSNAQISYYGKNTYAQTIYPYGLSANAPTNTLLLVINNMGQEENLAAFPYCAKERFKNLQAGEVIVGSPQTGSYIKFSVNGNIEIFSKNDINITATNNCNINAKKVTIKSDILEHIGSTLKTNASVQLGSGGQPIARKGDQVQVGSNIGSIISGSSANTSS